MLAEKLKKYNIILASASPRRQKLLKELKLNFSVGTKKIVVVYPSHLIHSEITDYLSQLKASIYTDLNITDLLVTSDTIVWKDEKALGKPKDFEVAKQMLNNLSGQMHEVITSVCFTSKTFQKTVNDVTKVWFKYLSEEEVDYYLKNYEPFDKAGSYGIQEWIGYVGIEKIEGSYYNVMGLPTQLVYKTLLEIANNP